MQRGVEEEKKMEKEKERREGKWIHEGKQANHPITGFW